MALGTFVYLRNVNNLSDARYAAGMGVDLIGFELTPNNPDALNPGQFKEISEWISGVKIVGEFSYSDVDEIREQLENFQVDYLLISDESQIHSFTQLGVPLILQVRTDQQSKDEINSTLNFCSGSVDYFLFESDEEEINDKEMISAFAGKFPVLLGYGLTSENVVAVAGDLNLKGISLIGGSEIRPGYKDFDALAEILEALEIE